MQEFQLKILPLDNNNYALELYQCAYRQAGEKKRPAAKRIGRIKGESLLLIKQAIYQALKANNYDPQTLSNKRQNPYILNEQYGVNLALLFQAAAPLKKLERIVNIKEGIMAMSNEEAHYWFAKINNNKHSSALRALRVLLGDI